MKLRLLSKREVENLNKVPVTATTRLYLQAVVEGLEATVTKTLYLPKDMSDLDIKKAVESAPRHLVQTIIRTPRSKKARVTYSVPDNALRLKAIKCGFRLRGLL
jgi:hypothetical protein